MMGDLIFEDLILVSLILEDLVFEDLILVSLILEDLVVEDLILVDLVALNQWQQAAMVTCNNLLQPCTQYFGDKKLLLLHGYLHLGDNCESTDHVTGRFYAQFKQVRQVLGCYWIKLLSQV